MVHLRPLALLALIAGAALAHPAQEELVLDDTSLHVAEKWSYINCGRLTDPIQLKTIKLLPDPPEPGQDLTVEVTGTVTEKVKEGAYAKVTVKLGLIKLLTKNFDLCEEARAAKTSIQCPVKEGNYTVTHTVALPKEIPPAKFSVSVEGYTVDDEDLLCLDLMVNFGKFPFLDSW